jgi:PAS domain S-box-containing protein
MMLTAASVGAVLDTGRAAELLPAVGGRSWSAPLRSAPMTAGPVAIEGCDDGDPEATLARLRDRAIFASDLAFTISDPTKPDNPLLWANPAFSLMTGYDLAEVRGHNCRLLQGPGTDRSTVDRLRDGIAKRQSVAVTLLNYRKDGTAFWNHLSVSPVFDGDGQLLSYVGVQSDVTDQVQIESERAQAYTAERAARRDAERSRQRLGLLATASTQLSEALDTPENLDRLATLVVPDLADWVVINLVDKQEQIEQSVLRHRAGQLGLLRRFDELQRDRAVGRTQSPRRFRSHPARRHQRGGVARLQRLG